MPAASKVVICKPEGTNSRGRSRCDIKRDIQENWCDGVDWIHLAQNRQHFWASAFTVIKLMRGVECLFQKTCSGPQEFRSIERVVYFSIIIIIIIIIIITSGRCWHYLETLRFHAPQICLSVYQHCTFFIFRGGVRLWLWKYGLYFACRSSHDKILINVE
jgi:hypothetical protein